MDKQSVICETCMKVHGRDTSAPVKCYKCGRIVGCFWHKGAFQHVRSCKGLGS